MQVSGGPSCLPSLNTNAVEQLSFLFTTKLIVLKCVHKVISFPLLPGPLVMSYSRVDSFQAASKFLKHSRLDY